MLPRDRSSNKMSSTGLDELSHLTIKKNYNIFFEGTLQKCKVPICMALNFYHLSSLVGDEGNIFLNMEYKLFLVPWYAWVWHTTDKQR